MQILISGGTGLIGSAITKMQGNEYYILTRGKTRDSGSIHYVNWDEIDSVPDCSVIINLAGYNIGEKKWNQRVKEEIIKSRIETTKRMVDFISRREKKPDAFLSGSAIGYYGYGDSSVFDENSPPGIGFLSELANAWEDEALKASKMCRTVLLRTSNVLSSDGGFLAKIANRKSKRVYYFGSGKQPVSWIHIDDYVSAVKFIIENASISGPVNMASPNPTDFAGLADSISRIHGYRKAHIPEFAGKILLGSEMYRELMSGQRVKPSRLLAASFQFRYGSIDEAVKNLNL